MNVSVDVLFASTELVIFCREMLAPTSCSRLWQIKLKHPSPRTIQNARYVPFCLAFVQQADCNMCSQAIVLAVLNLPQALAVTIVMSLLSDPFDCDRPLGIWVIVAAVRQVISVICMAANARYHGAPTPPPVWARFLTSLYQPLSTFNLVWFIFGNLWYIGSEENSCDPHLRKLALSLVIIQYIVMFLPCIILMVSLPFACLCFPLFMRIVSVLNPAPPDQARGITREEILAATRVAKWHPGMFGTSEDDNMCTITMEEYKEGDQVRVLPCEHHFSEEAISTWLRQHNTCPLCRQPIVQRGGGDSGTEGGGSGNQVATADSNAALQNVTTVHVSQAPSSAAVPSTSASQGNQYARMPDV